MKKTLTLLTSAMFIIATFVACDSEEQQSETNIAVTAVSLNQTTATLSIGGTVQLTETISPENATNQNVTWNSNNDAVASVNQSGVVTAISTGTAIITVTTQDGNHIARCTITVIPNTDLGVPVATCNNNIPGWGANLGTITWGSTTNTNIESGATTTTGTGSRPNQIWSGAVFATACAKGNATNSNEFNSGTTGNFNADCRQSLHTFNAGRANAITGDFFSWCAVMRFANQLCPYPFRVPTRQDFIDLDINMGGNGQNIHASATEIHRYMPAVGTAQNPQIGGIWGGARFTGSADVLEGVGSTYWSATEASATNVFLLHFNEEAIHPQLNHNNRGVGLALRCVRNN